MNELNYGKTDYGISLPLEPTIGHMRGTSLRRGCIFRRTIRVEQEIEHIPRQAALYLSVKQILYKRGAPQIYNMAVKAAVLKNG